MSNVFITLTSCYSDASKIRFNPNLIESYVVNGAFTVVTATSRETYTVQESPEQIDQLLVECYFMVKGLN